MNPKKILYITFAIWLLIFAGLIASKEYTLRTGEELLLKTVPVDPRDMFRGDYVVLNYEISRLDLDEVPAESADFEYDDRIYLAMELEDGYGVPKKIYRTPPEGELYIKGTVKSITYDYEPTAEEVPHEEPPVPRRTSVSEIRVEYGIESYFVPEGRGREIETQQWKGKRVDVRVVLDRQGNAIIKDLLIDGEKVAF